MSWSAEARYIDPSTVTFTISRVEATESFHVKCATRALRASGEATLAASLPIACHTSQDLRITAPVHRALARNAAEIMLHYTSTPPNLDLVHHEDDDGNPGRGLACFFSLGVDSFYALCARRREISSLIMVRGFDLASPADQQWQNIVSAAARIAQQFGKELVEVVTDVRAVSDRYCHWAKVYHGAAMATVAHLLDPWHYATIIPSSPIPGNPKWGSAASLDPLWSLPHHQIEYFPLGVDRITKLRAVTNAGLSTELRVCTSAFTSYNCGRCEKCIRTWSALYALTGRIDMQFDSQLDLGAVAEANFKPHVVPWHVETLALLRRLPHQRRWPQLEDALAERLSRVTSCGQAERPSPDHSWKA